jgi:hypothetical protein
MKMLTVTFFVSLAVRNRSLLVPLSKGIMYDNSVHSTLQLDFAIMKTTDLINMKMWQTVLLSQQTMLKLYLPTNEDGAIICNKRVIFTETLTKYDKPLSRVILPNVPVLVFVPDYAILCSRRNVCKRLEVTEGHMPNKENILVNSVGRAAMPHSWGQGCVAVIFVLYTACTGPYGHDETWSHMCVT